MASSRYYSQNMVYVDLKTVAQQRREKKDLPKYLEQWLNRVATQWVARAGQVTSVKTAFRVVIWKNDKSEVCNFGYVFFQDPQVAQMVLGHNPNGTERVELFPDPAWKPPIIASASSPDFAIDWFPGMDGHINRSKSWADLQEEEEARLEALKPRMLSRKLPPYIDTGNIKIAAAWENDVGEDRSYSTLQAVIPNGTTEKDIRDIFAFFSTSVSQTYPMIKMWDSRGKHYASVTFDHCTRDAQFARVMRRFNTIRNEVVKFDYRLI